MPLSLFDKVGQLLVFGWDYDGIGDPTLINSHARALVEELRVGGVILMGRNVGNPARVSTTISALQCLSSLHNLPPLLVCTDQEGGRVARFAPPHYPEFPPAQNLGASDNTALTEKSAQKMGEMLRSVGVNWALMPVLDVANNPLNTVIGDRSYGNNPVLVSEMGRAAIRGLQSAGVMACGKHFPGHGDTAVDSHFDLPVVDRSIEELRSFELLPFEESVRVGIGSIMTSHILFPKIDGELPATLSPSVLTGILRERLNFDGLVITDCLEMAGVAKGWGSAESAVLAIDAGADMVLACHTLSTQRKIKETLIDAVQSGRLSEKRVDQAYARVCEAKVRWIEV